MEGRGVKNITGKGVVDEKKAEKGVVDEKQPERSSG